MTIIKHENFNSFLKDTPRKSLPKLILICGESFLTSQAFENLEKIILDNQHAPEFSVETLDGSNIPIGDIIEQLNTFSFLPAPKIVTVKNAPLFSANRTKGFSYGEEESRRLENICLSPTPEDHFLVFISHEMDKRKKIFKRLNEHALIVDCTVPIGNLKSNREVQIKIARSIAEKIVNDAEKNIESRALQTLMDRIGYEPRNIAVNIEKLINFCGNKCTITNEDVLTLIKREKKDPIFAFSNAVMDKNIDASLFYLSSLLSDQFHPLQIIKSIENQIRKLLLAKYYLKGHDSPVKGVCIKSISFQRFSQEISPLIIKKDDSTKKFMDEAFLLSTNSKKNKKTISSDLLLAPNPKNLYPVFQVCQKSEHFTLNELETAIMQLADMDYKLKTSVLSPVILIEHFIINFCTPAPIAPASRAS